MSILITGAAGFIGSNFVLNWLEKNKEKVIALDKLTYAGNLENLKSVEKKLNYEFVQGDIENIPLPDNLFDVVISNCVLNLVPDKEKAFSEIYRVLKHSGHFCISDVVLSGTLPKGLQEDAEMYAGCVSGALQKEDYLGIIQNQGFSEIKIHNEKKIVIPDHIKTNYLSEKELNNFKKSKIGIYSITVTANKSI